MDTQLQLHLKPDDADSSLEGLAENLDLKEKDTVEQSNFLELSDYAWCLSPANTGCAFLFLAWRKGYVKEKYSFCQRRTVTKSEPPRQKWPCLSSSHCCLGAPVSLSLRRSCTQKATEFARNRYRRFSPSRFFLTLSPCGTSCVICSCFSFMTLEKKQTWLISVDHVHL